MVFACPSLGQTISTGKGWPLLGTELSMLLSMSIKTHLHSSPSPPPLKNRHVEARLREHWLSRSQRQVTGEACWLIS